MSINLKAPELRELKPRIMVCGVGGAGGNAVNNMIVSGLSGVDFIVANTDAQALTSSRAERIIQMGLQVTEGLGAGSKPEVGKAAANGWKEIYYFNDILPDKPSYTAVTKTTYKFDGSHYVSAKTEKVKRRIR